ncbi:MAG TPA: NB-ARC domain-containing protein, partial [Micromonosporaceae bacterium]|nr:NB-ARC domain-containing protein [Micromonosporaceae bacterium]
MSIVGMPGVGKSTLAIHGAHLARDRYPDGQVYLDLHRDGIGSLDSFGAAGEVLGGLGLPADSLPPTQHGRSALLRSICADRRFLVVLDNATSVEQVAPLIPANQDCAVVITSRQSLGEMSAWSVIELAPMDERESRDLLVSTMGQQRVANEPLAVGRILELCGGLPLAIRIAGARFTTRPHHTVAWLADRLASEDTRLDELKVSGATLRASFDLSYRGLSSDRQRALRLLSLLDVPDFGVWLAAAALDCPVRDAEDQIDGLVAARLLGVVATATDGSPRFGFHQLVRLYAKDLSESIDSEVERLSALTRGYEACLLLANQMDQRLRVHDRPTSGGVRSGVADLVAQTLSVDPNVWFRAERDVLVAAVHGAARQQWHDLTWDLSLALQRFFESHNNLSDWVATATRGLAAARLAGHRGAESALLCSLGEAHVVRDELSAAAESFGAALTVAREINDGRAQAHALRGLSVVNRARGRLADATEAARDALALTAQYPDASLAADIWMSLGSIQHLQRATTEAESSYLRALRGFGSTGDQMNEAIV